VKSEIRKHYDRAHNLAFRATVKKARRILQQHSNLDEFIMGMGRWMFTEKGKPGHLSDGERAYFHPLEIFLKQWDNELKITGCPVRFTAKGKAVYDW